MLENREIIFGSIRVNLRIILRNIFMRFMVIEVMFMKMFANVNVFSGLVSYNMRISRNVTHKYRG